MDIKESTIQKRVMDYLKMCDVFHWRSPNITVRRRKNILTRGVADIIALYKGVLLSIEVKKPDGIVSEEQKKFAENVSKNGGVNVIAYSVQDVRSALLDIDQRTSSKAYP